MPNLLAALLFLPAGFILGILLVANLIQVFSLGFLSMAFLMLLPTPLAPLAALAQGLLVNPLLVGTGFSFLVVLFVISFFYFISYWVASSGLPVATLAPGSPALGLVAVSPAERIGRGMLIGITTGLNYILLMAFLSPSPGGIFLSGTLALINFTACLLPASNNPVFQSVLGYSTLFLPMALPINLAGLVVSAINSVALAAGNPVDVFADWRRGVFVMHGGVVHGFQRTAFNMANFAVAHGDMGRTRPWVSPGTPLWPFSPPGLVEAPGVYLTTVDGVMLHEDSHTLNVGAFGWVYHLIGWADEFLAMPWSGGVVLGANAHAELTAEGGLRASGRNWIDMWTPGLAVAGVGNVVPVSSAVPAAGPGVVPISVVTDSLIVCERNRGVTLDTTGTVNTDVYPGPMGRLWQFAPAGGLPAGSNAILTPDFAAILTFVPDVGGLYILEYHVTDGMDGGAGGVSGIHINVTLDVLAAAITPPTGPFPVGTPFILSSAASAIPVSGIPGTGIFTWTVTSAPGGSALGNTGGSGPTFTLTPDVAGDYSVRLLVNVDALPAAGPPVTLSDSTGITLTFA